MPKSLVIVESPTKARTIARFLDDDYIVESSIGHIRDLPESAREIPESVKKQPWARLGIDVEHDFKPLYVIPEDKRKQVGKLKSLLKQVENLYLATDEDREGESISWHLKQVLEPKVPTRRLVFHEITREAIRAALQAPREIDDRLVIAQETRRVLDRLYGYEISPLLWRKIAPALSAGRVQSVAVRMVVNRERARMAFQAAAWWDLLGRFAAVSGGEPFEAALIALDGRRLVSGKDFDDTTGRLRPGKEALVHLDEPAAQALRERLATEDFRVVRLERKPYTSSPAPPFTTSTLQQEANRKLGLSSRETMRVAQSLYERGFITYMRTDSTTLSEQALTAARRQIGELYGADYLPAEPRVYRSRVRNAQEAHEAVRPAGEAFRRPEQVRGELEIREHRLYEMIWKRTVASQMANARGQRIVLGVEGGGATFQATGKTIEFPGFLRAYVEGSDDPEAELGDQERLLPPLAEGQTLACRGLEALEHVTQAPARYTDASLVKELEKEGIGRPSTYASIIDTIVRRAYVTRKGNTLVPTFTAFAVVRLMEQYFTHLVDLGFTASMEDTLDAISRGEQESLPYLKAFYEGNRSLPGLKGLLQAEIDPRSACTIPLEQAPEGEAINVRIGKFGPYLERDGERASLPAGIAPDELTGDRARELLARGSAPDVLGSDPETGRTVYLKTGRYGPYVQLGETGETPKMKSLLPGQSPEGLTLDDALQLLSLPRTLGADPDSGEPVVVDLGRYGPYVKRGKDSRSLFSAQALFTITLDEALAVLRQEKSGRRGGPVLMRALGSHPEGGAPVNLMSGRFGPYVTDGTINASLPRSADPEALGLEQAVELLRARAARGPTTAPRRAAKGRTATKAKGRAGKAASKAGKGSTTRKRTQAAKAGTDTTRAKSGTKPGKTASRKKGSRREAG